MIDLPFPNPSSHAANDGDTSQRLICVLRTEKILLLVLLYRYGLTNREVNFISHWSGKQSSSTGVGLPPQQLTER